MSTFQDWMNEKDLINNNKNIVSRMNRIYHETIVDPPNDPIDHWKLIEKWIKTAYICGKIDTAKYFTETYERL
jgi:hypothetical protein